MKALREFVLLGIFTLSAAGVVAGLCFAVSPNPLQDSVDELRKSNDELERQMLLTFEHRCVEAGKHWSKSGNTYTCAASEGDR